MGAGTGVTPAPAFGVVVTGVPARPDILPFHAVDGHALVAGVTSPGVCAAGLPPDWRYSEACAAPAANGIADKSNADAVGRGIPVVGAVEIADARCCACCGINSPLTPRDGASTGVGCTYHMLSRQAPSGPALSGIPGDAGSDMVRWCCMYRCAVEVDVRCDEG